MALKPLIMTTLTQTWLLKDVEIGVDRRLRLRMVMVMDVIRREERVSGGVGCWGPGASNMHQS